MTKYNNEIQKQKVKIHLNISSCFLITKILVPLQPQSAFQGANSKKVKLIRVKIMFNRNNRHLLTFNR